MTAADPLRHLGVRVGPHTGELRVWSEHADAMDLYIFDETDPHWIVKTVGMERDAHGVWTGTSRSLAPGTRYGVGVSGPTGPRNAFSAKPLLEPYARGLTQVGANEWRSVVVDGSFDWGGSVKPGIPLERTLVYEAHVRGLTKLNTSIPAELRGTYAGLCHPSTVGYLTDLGVTSLELLPVHAFLTEGRLKKQGLTNYWGYNTLNFFTPHAPYATRAAQEAGPEAVLSEFKTMVRRLHDAGLEVILDVVYNHTAEEGRTGPVLSFRGIDNASYYRQNADGTYIDVTGCGNTVNFGHDVPVRLVLDSLRYWANEVQVDGFRFDLASALGRNAQLDFDPRHPLLEAVRADPELAGAKLIAEPWDVGHGGWQTGHFPAGWQEWNDRYRDRMRGTWLTDVAATRGGGAPQAGIGRFATRLAGSSTTFSDERGPLASLNFVTAHDGFTLADLTAYNEKHNLGNGEGNRDGASDNHSFNHGVEGPTRDRRILASRRQAMRNLLGTLLLSAGVPMMTAGDEFGRSQSGNNNAYCHDSELTWLNWTFDDWQKDLHAVTRHLIRLRRENPALRPDRYARPASRRAAAVEMDWFNSEGRAMSQDDWESPDALTLQYLAAAPRDDLERNRVLLIVHAQEQDTTVTLPRHRGVRSYVQLWDSSTATPRVAGGSRRPGTLLPVPGVSMQLFRAEG